MNACPWCDGSGMVEGGELIALAAELDAAHVAWRWSKLSREQHIPGKYYVEAGIDVWLVSTPYPVGFSARGVGEAKVAQELRDSLIQFGVLT